MTEAGLTTQLLNDNQRRHVTTALHLLQADVRRLLQRGDLSQSARTALEAVARLVPRLQAAFDLPPVPSLSARREVQAVASVWAMRIDDLRTRRLRAYGRVHPGLQERLDPLVDELRTALLRVTGESDGSLPPGTSPDGDHDRE
jgi:hypothetical protein